MQAYLHLKALLFVSFYMILILIPILRKIGINAYRFLLNLNNVLHDDFQLRKNNIFN
jgi:hypothetical protein